MKEIIAQKSNIRLDIFLAELLPDFSRAKIQELVKNGNIFVNGKKSKSSYS